jgi:hypothetical protein
MGISTDTIPSRNQTWFARKSFIYSWFFPAVNLHSKSFGDFPAMFDDIPNGFSGTYLACLTTDGTEKSKTTKNLVWTYKLHINCLYSVVDNEEKTYYPHVYSLLNPCKLRLQSIKSPINSRQNTSPSYLSSDNPTWLSGKRPCSSRIFQPHLMTPEGSGG